MGHTNSTANYNLPQFVGTDKPSWLGDINNAFSAIDTAIANAASTATTADGKADALGTTVSGHTTQIGTLSNTVTSQGNTLNTVTALIGNGTPTTTDQTIIGAINEINAKISTKYEVAADGVKTYGDALDSLFSHISEVKQTSKIALTLAGRVRVLSVYSYSDAGASFSGLSFDSSNNVTGVVCDMQSTSGLYGASGGSVTTHTNTVIPSDTSVILYI